MLKCYTRSILNNQKVMYYFIKECKKHNTQCQISFLMTQKQTHISVRNCGFLCKQQKCAFNADTGPFPFGKNTYCSFQETLHLHHYLAAKHFTHTQALTFHILQQLTYFIVHKHVQSQWDSSSALQFSELNLLRKSQQDIQYGWVT